MPAKLKVLYIAGIGKSGSTLLDLMLGAHSRIESAGEFKKVHAHFAEKESLPAMKQLCTCGSMVVDCDFWGKVRQKLADPGIMTANLNRAGKSLFARGNWQIMQAVLETAGKEVFCDSSKNIGRARALLASDLFDVRVIHLVRDPRATVFSKFRKGHSYLRKLVEWHRTFRQAMSVKKRHPDTYLMVRYEDLVKDPRVVLQSILSQFDLEFEAAQLEPFSVSHHNLAGNHMRFEEKPIRWDSAYLYQTPRTFWAIGTLVCSGVLKRLDYPASRAGLNHMMGKASS